MITAGPLSHILAQMQDTLAQLRMLLHREHELFAKADLDIAALSKVTQQKTAMVEQLEHHEQKRRTVIGQQGLDASQREASQAAAEAIDAGSCWLNILESAQQIKSLNAVSATIIQERSRVDRQLLNALRPDTSESLYSATGRPQRGAASRYRITG